MTTIVIWWFAFMLVGVDKIPGEKSQIGLAVLVLLATALIWHYKWGDEDEDVEEEESQRFPFTVHLPIHLYDLVDGAQVNQNWKTLVTEIDLLFFPVVGTELNLIFHESPILVRIEKMRWNETHDVWILLVNEHLFLREKFESFQDLALTNWEWLEEKEEA